MRADNAYFSGSSHLIEDQQRWATDASVLRAYARDQVTSTDDYTKVERHLKRLARSKAMQRVPRAAAVEGANGSVFVPLLQQTNKRGQRVSVARVRKLRRTVTNQYTGEIITRKIYQVGYYAGGSGFLTVRDGRVAAADIARILGGTVEQRQRDYVLVS